MVRENPISVVRILTGYLSPSHRSLEFIRTCFAVHAVYHYVVVEWGNPEALPVSIWYVNDRLVKNRNSTDQNIRSVDVNFYFHSKTF